MKDSKMHMSLEEVLWPNIFLLSIVGIWPLPPGSNNISRLFIYIRIIIHFIVVSFLIIPIFYTIIVTWGDVSVLADYGGVMFMYVLMIFKLAYVIMCRQDCHRVHREVMDFWEMSQITAERRCFEDFAMLAKVVTIVGMISGGGDILMYVVPPGINDLLRYRLTDNRTSIRRILPLDISYGFDYQHSPLFEILFVMQIFGFFCSTASVIGNDCTVMTIILHISGQFRLLSYRLEAIGNEIYSHKLGGANDRLVITKIGRCIKHHQRVVRVAAELSDLVGPMALGQILTSGLVVCFGGFSIMKGNSSEAEIVKFGILFISIIVQLVIWCWPGELLIQESGAIAQTLFSKMPWFMLPTAIQRDLSFVMLRARKESKIFSFFQVMSLRKLTEVFNTAGSYMALLRSMQD